MVVLRHRALSFEDFNLTRSKASDIEFVYACKRKRADHDGMLIIGCRAENLFLLRGGDGVFINHFAEYGAYYSSQ